MLWFKDAVTKGVYYNSIGIKDYTAWSQKMLEDFGSEIKSHLKDVRKWSLFLINSDSENLSGLNCWQFMGCGMQSNGKKLNKNFIQTCPACQQKKLDGVHGGINGGRACWVVLRTKCYGSIQKTYEQKHSTCSGCDFYKSVIEEEETAFLKSYKLQQIH